jgi:aspartate aminotransferase-like enzyme
MKMKVMVVGPTEIEDDVRLAGSAHLVYNRTPEFSEFIFGIENKLKQVFRTSNDVYLLSCSGTGVMECALVNFLSAGDKVFILSSGVFGDRWLEIATSYGLNCQYLKTEQGQQADLSLLTAALKPDVKAVFVTANETSSGTTCDLEAIGKIVKPSNALLIVDAVSSLSANRLETDTWHCDVVVSSTNKALALPPGIGLITVSEKAWQYEAVATLPKYYFDLKRYRENLLNGQTPFTPAISLLFQLNLRLDKILAEGLDKVIERHRTLSDYLRAQLQLLNIRTFDINPSNGMVGISFGPGIDAYEVVYRLRKEFQIQITPSPEPDKNKIARVGLFGNLHIKDVDDFIAALKQVIGRI